MNFPLIVLLLQTFLISVSGQAYEYLTSPRLTSTYASTFSAAYEPRGLVKSSDGSFFVSATNYAIYKIDTNGASTLFAGFPDSFNSIDGVGSNARFQEPWGMCIDDDDKIWVATLDTIRTITPSAEVSRIPSSTDFGMWGLYGPHSIKRGLSTGFTAGSFLITNTLLHKVHMMNTAFEVVTLAGIEGNYVSAKGAANGVGTYASFYGPSDVAVCPVTGSIYVTDLYNHLIRKIAIPSFIVTTASGGTSPVNGLGGGYLDGAVATAKFYYPESVAVDPNGNVIITDGNHAVRVIIRATQTVKTVAGAYPLTGIGTFARDGLVDGVGTYAHFYFPQQIWIETSGILYIADRATWAIRKVSWISSPTKVPSRAPSTRYPTYLPSTRNPTVTPSTRNPANVPTKAPSAQPTSRRPTSAPTTSTKKPTSIPTSRMPTKSPSRRPTKSPTTRRPT